MRFFNWLFGTQQTAEPKPHSPPQQPTDQEVFHDSLRSRESGENPSAQQDRVAHDLAERIATLNPTQLRELADYLSQGVPKGKHPSAPIQGAARDTLYLVAERDDERYEIIRCCGEGFYVFRYINGQNTHDYLQDDMSMAQGFAEDQWGLPRSAWREAMTGESPLWQQRQ